MDYTCLLELIQLYGLYGLYITICYLLSNLISNSQVIYPIMSREIMTDTINVSLSLSKLSVASRMQIPREICNVSNQDGEVTNRYVKPSKQKSPLSATNTKWVVRCELDSSPEDHGLVPVVIESELHIPNAIVGHNLEHGTSVLAAAYVALRLICISLAESGLPKSELDLLSTDDIAILGVTLTYLIACPTRSCAEALVNSINETGKLVNSKWKMFESTNMTVYLPARDHTVNFYLKTDLDHCKWQGDAPVPGMIDQALRIVRIEAKLGLVFLRKRGLTTVANWRYAYEERLYAKLFDETVRKSLRLGDQLRHKLPRQEVYQRLTATEARLLDDYIHGVDPRQFESVIKSMSPNKRFSELRLNILKTANVDIDIPWKDHTKLRCFELEEQLRYPGDYHPSEEHAPWCFCQTNWDGLVEKMGIAYENAFNSASAKAA
jgi:hypothetical protein